MVSKVGFADEFDYEAADGNDTQFSDNWGSENNLSWSDDYDWGRYPENIRVTGGYLETLLKKDNRSEEKPYSSAAFWTKRTFGYGYYEAKWAGTGFL